MQKLSILKFHHKRRTVTFLAISLLVAFAHQLAGVMFLRFNAPAFEVTLAVVSVVLAVSISTRLPVAVWLGIAWLVLSLASVLWSLSPAMSVRASMWHGLYVAALIITSAAPRYALVGLTALHSWLILQGVDTLIITGRDDFSGVWHQQNVQGGQLLLFVPLLAHWTFQRKHWSVYVALPLGFCLFLSALTFSTASQVLLLVGVIAVWWWQRHQLEHPHAAWEIAFLLIVGVGLGWLVSQPQTMQVFGLTLGDASHVVRVSDPTDTLLARLQIIQDVGRRAFAALPLGTGAGSLRDIYSHLQRHTIESVDAHNYYLQTLLTLGVLGVSLLVALFITGLQAAKRAQHAGLWVALFLFMGYLAFDVMAYFPGVMLLFFATLGVAQGLSTPSLTTSSLSSLSSSPHSRYAVAAGFVMLGLFWWWWLQPCNDLTCFAGRKLADPMVVRQNLSQLTTVEQLEWASIGAKHYPETLFYARLYAQTRQTLEDIPQVSLYRDIAQQFPAADLGVYRDWRDAAIRAGDFAEALEASRESLRYFSDANDLALTP